MFQAIFNLYIIVVFSCLCIAFLLKVDNIIALEKKGELKNKNTKQVFKEYVFNDTQLIVRIIISLIPILHVIMFMSFVKGIAKIVLIKGDKEQWI